MVLTHFNQDLCPVPISHSDLIWLLHHFHNALELFNTRPFHLAILLILIRTPFLGNE